MAPAITIPFDLVERGPDGSLIVGRSLQHPNHTQQVTLGVIAAYAVGIAILWNVPYLRMVLWPFKVSQPSHVLLAPNL